MRLWCPLEDGSPSPAIGMGKQAPPSASDVPRPGWAGAFIMMEAVLDKSGVFAAVARTPSAWSALRRSARPGPNSTTTAPPPACSLARRLLFPSRAPPSFISSARSMSMPKPACSPVPGPGNAGGGARDARPDVVDEQGPSPKRVVALGTPEGASIEYPTLPGVFAWSTSYETTVYFESSPSGGSYATEG